MRISYIDEFLELYKCVNFNEAARNLFISQSTLSKHIKALEEDLGVKLFNRDKYYSELTIQGNEFYAYAVQISKAYKAAQEQFANESVAKGRFLVGGLMDSMREVDWLNRATRTMRKAHPQFNPMFIPSGVSSPMGELLSGNLDALVLAHEEYDESDSANGPVRAIPLKKVPLMALVNRESPLAGLPCVKAEDLKRKTFIHMMGPRMQSGWKSVEQFLASLHIEYDTRLVPIMSMYDYPGILLAPDEVLLIPRCELAPGEQSEDVLTDDTVALPIAEPTAFTPLHLIFRKDSAPSYMEEFADVLIATPLFASACPNFSHLQ